jgi:uncharacterized protein with ParB-like and HNH nuclease domain
MSLKIDRPLGEIFKSMDISKINIPIFQRPYSWPKEQIGQYLIDLDNAVKNNSCHFFGLIVYVFQEKQAKTIDIIDGQQRLTTAVINLSVIRDLMEDLDCNITWTYEDRRRNADEISKINHALKTKQECRLHTSNEGKFENEFIEIIQNSILDYTDKSKSPRKEYEEQKPGNKNRFSIKKVYLEKRGDGRKTKAMSSYKNYISIHNYINDKLLKINNNEDKFELLIKYSDVLLENFRYIPFEVESTEQAFEYFEVLNDRGLDISALDLIKNECLKKQLTEEQRKDVFDTWTEIFANTLDQNDNLIQFVRYAYMREYGHITKREIYPSYKTKIQNLNFIDLNDYLSNNLLVRAKIYKDFIKIGETNLKPKFHNVIQLLKSTKTVQWYSIAMSALEPLYTSKKITLKTEDKILELLENIHEIMFSLNYVNVVANNIETKYPDIAKSITYTNETDFVKSLEKAINEVNKIKNIERLSFDNVDLSNSNQLISSFETNNDLGNMLIFLFKYYDKKSSDDKFNVGSLEHLFPQKPSEFKWPVIKKMKIEEKRDIIYSLGNFFITNVTLNPSIGNKSFKDKLTIYKKWNLYDILPEVSKLHYTKVQDWTPEVVKERSEWISESFKERFKS